MDNTIADADRGVDTYRLSTATCMCLVCLPAEDDAGRKAARKRAKKHMKKFCRSVKVYFTGEWDYVIARDYFTGEEIGGFGCAARNRKKAKKQFAVMYRDLSRANVSIEFEDFVPLPA